jgi:hypothetical protein
MPAVEVVIPFAGTCPHRLRALDWVLARYGDRHPDWEITVAWREADEWVKARAVMPAVAASSAPVVVVADADVWTDGLTEAAAAVAAGSPWAMPHRRLFRLTRQATGRVLDGEPWQGQELDERPYPGVWGGGVVAVARQTMLDCPLDPRFVGWGQEDTAWAVALHAQVGAGWRGDADLVHLWHPPQPRLSRRFGSPDGRRLYRRYCTARRDPAQLAELLGEARDALATP